MYNTKTAEHKGHSLINVFKIAVRIPALFVIASILISVFCVPLYSSAAGENKVVRVGWYDSIYFYRDKNGRRRGLAYEYQQKLVAYTGWTYEYVEGSWPELLQKLKDGEIDMLSDVSYTRERDGSILYPNVPMGSETYYIFVKAGNSDISIDDFESFSGKVFAADKGSVMEDLTLEWARKNGIDIIFRGLMDPSVDECFEMLDKGEIDAYVTVESYGNRDNVVPVCPIGSTDSYFAISKNRPDLLKELNSALISIQNENPYYNQKLLQKYLWSANTNAYLTDKEISFLSKHGTIRVAYRNNYMPFCSDSDGQLIGALGDFLSNSSDILKNTQVEFEPVAFSTTDGCLKALEDGEVDVVFPVNLSAYDLEKRGLVSTENLMHTEIFAVVRPAGSGDIFSQKNVTVALLEGNVNFDVFVQDFYPDWTIEHRPTLDECYGAVSQGKADCAMVNSYRLTQNDRLRRQHKLALLATGQNMGFSFAVNRGDGELYSIMNKIITLTDESETETNLSRYNGSNTKITFEDFIADNALTVAVIVLAIAMVILILIVITMRSDKKASDRQKLILATELDPLTGLYTRNYFFEYAGRMYRESSDKRYDAIVLNIEQFHIVNAVYGWDYGDRVLKVLGEQIRNYIDEDRGIACRSQSDRFDIYAAHTDDYRAVYEIFQGALDSAFEKVNIRIRMGVMPYTPELEPVELFDRARTACGMIKSSKHEMLKVFNEEMRKREILEQRLLSDLRDSLDQREFKVFYQPKYNVQSDPPVLQSAEALVRWKHHELGMIPPGKFVDLFEKQGQIGLIDRYVWDEAARQIGEWKKKYGVSIPVSVNLSRVDFFDPDLIQVIEDIVAKYGIDRWDLHLEVTESAYTDDTELIIDVVENLRRLGYIIEMDDFGTGYSSLHMLSTMPVDILKLDKSFVDKLDKSVGKQEDIRLVELILDIARNLLLSVVAEGVEKEEQLQFLKERGCEMVQGYYFSPPLPPESFEELLKN